MVRTTATPKADRVLDLRDGRHVAYCEWGRSDGRPVVLFHGMPGSRLLCPDEDETERANVRLFTIDRPGYGLSSPKPDRRMLTWVDDYAEWADLVGLPPCPIIGWSGGGPYALACAVQRPEYVTSVVLAASSAPLDEVPSEWEDLDVEVRNLMTLLRADAQAAMEGITARCQWLTNGWETMFDEGLSAADEALVAMPGVLDSLLTEMREAVRQGTSGYVADWVADGFPWGFSPADVPHTVQIWWGDDDNLVGRASAEYFARVIKRSTLTVLPGDGHLFPIGHWADMLAALD